MPHFHRLTGSAACHTTDAMAQTRKKSLAQTRSTIRPSSAPKIPAVNPMKEAILEALRDLISERKPSADDDGPISERTSIPPPPRPIHVRAPAAFTRHAMHALEEAGLTPAEIKIAILVLQGKTNEQISLEAELSQKTVKHHIGSVFRKFAVDSRAQLSAKIFPI